MNSEPTKSSEQLHKEVLRELDKVEMDIDEIKGRMSPGQFIDDAIFYPHGGDINAAFGHLKRNPIGSSFLAIGTLLLMEDENNESFETTMKNKSRSMVSETKKGLSAIKDGYREGKEQGKAAAWEDLTQTDQVDFSEPSAIDKAKSQFESSKEDFAGKGQELKNEAQNRAGEIKQELSSRADELKREAQAKSGEIKHGLRSKAGELKGKAQELSENLKSRSQDFKERGQEFREEARHKGEAFKEGALNKISSAKETVRGMDPLAFAAIGLGLGALTGAALPVSDKESDIVDSKLGERLSNLKGDIQSALDESAGVLKDAFISDFKNVDVNIFSRGGKQSSSSTPGL